MAQSLLKSVFAGGYSKLFTSPANRRIPSPTPHQFQFQLRINTFYTSSNRSSNSRDFLSLSDELLMDQCEMNTFKASGPGGQHRNKRETAVRLKHSPTGIIAQKLADLSTAPNARLIDGILLTNFDTIDAKVGAALTMVYISKAPVMFVGCKQSYTDIKKLNVKYVCQVD